MSDITLESLIQEHKERIGQLKYKPDPPGCWGFSYYYYDDSESYQKWLATAKRFIGIKYPNDKDVNELDIDPYWTIKFPSDDDKHKFDIFEDEGYTTYYKVLYKFAFW